MHASSVKKKTSVSTLYRKCLSLVDLGRHTRAEQRNRSCGWTRRASRREPPVAKTVCRPSAWRCLQSRNARRQYSATAGL